MEIKLSDMWTVAGFLLGLQITVFLWRVSREITMAGRRDITWLPPADIMNLIAMSGAFLGVFALPIVGIESFRIPRMALAVSLTLFAGYPFALAGHYELYTKGPRSYAYCTQQEKIAVLVTVIVAVVLLVVSVWYMGLL